MYKIYTLPIRINNPKTNMVYAACGVYNTALGSNEQCIASISATIGTTGKNITDVFSRWETTGGYYNYKTICISF